MSQYMAQSQNMISETHNTEEGVHERPFNLEIRVDLLDLVRSSEDTVELLALLAHHTNGDPESVTLRDGIKGILSTTICNLQSLGNGFLLVMIRNGSVSTVRLGEVERVRGADTENFVAQGLGDLDTEKTDRRRSTVDDVLRKKVREIHVSVVRQETHPGITRNLGVTGRESLSLSLNDGLQYMQSI